MALLIYLAAMMGLDEEETQAGAQQKAYPRLIEKARFDRDQSGKVSTVSLFRQEDAKGETSN
jgi:hypothetical protein